MANTKLILISRSFHERSPFRLSTGKVAACLTNVFVQDCEDDDDDEFPDDDEIELAVSGILRDLKKTLSASLRSLSIRSGSLTRSVMHAVFGVQQLHRKMGGGLPGRVAESESATANGR